MAFRTGDTDVLYGARRLVLRPFGRTRNRQGPPGPARLAGMFGDLDRVLQMAGGENFRIAIQQRKRHLHQRQGGFRAIQHNGS